MTARAERFAFPGTAHERTAASVVVAAFGAETRGRDCSTTRLVDYRRALADDFDGLEGLTRLATPEDPFAR